MNHVTNPLTALHQKLLLHAGRLDVLSGSKIGYSLYYRWYKNDEAMAEWHWQGWTCSSLRVNCVSASVSNTNSTFTILWSNPSLLGDKLVTKLLRQCTAPLEGLNSEVSAVPLPQWTYGNKSCSSLFSTTCSNHGWLGHTHIAVEFMVVTANYLSSVFNYRPKCTYLSLSNTCYLKL